MSSKLSAFSYIQGSGVNYWDNNQVSTLVNLIQNIQDGLYLDGSKIYLDIIRYVDHHRSALGVVIKGVSLGDGEKEIKNKGDIAQCVEGIRGRIAILYEYYGKKGSVDLSEVQNITRGNTIDRISLVDVSEDATVINLQKTPPGTQKMHVSH